MQNLQYLAKNCDKKKLVNACLLRMPRCAFVYKGMEIYTGV